MSDDNVVFLSPPAVLQLKTLSNFPHRVECEATGYALAPDLCSKRGFTPEMLLLVAIIYAEVDLNVDSSDFDIEKTLAEIYGNLGVIRWCLDQRQKLH